MGTKRKRELKVPGNEKVSDIYGEIPDLSFLKSSGLEMTPKKILKADPNSLVTDLKGVFAGGDMLNGPTSVIKAIGSGRRAATSIDRYLCGESLELEVAAAATIGVETVDTGMFKKRAQQAVPKKGCYDDEAAFVEAERCLQCGLFPKE